MWNDFELNFSAPSRTRRTLAGALLTWVLLLMPGILLSAEAVPTRHNYSSLDYAVSFHTHMNPNFSIALDQEHMRAPFSPNTVMVGHNNFLDVEKCSISDGECIEFGAFFLFNPVTFEEGTFDVDGKGFTVHDSEIVLLGRQYVGKRVSSRDERGREVFNFFWHCELGVILFAVVGENYPLSRNFMLADSIGIYASAGPCSE